MSGAEMPSLAAASSSASSSSSSAHPLASSLAPTLQAVHQGRLHDFRWFRADWQRGGASTAHAVLDPPMESSGGATSAASPLNVIVKIPVGDAELRWTRWLQDADDPDPVAPRLYSSDDVLGGYDFAWIVIEDLPCGPLGARWSPTTIPRIADAAARFYARTAAHPIDRCPMREDWHDTLQKAKEIVKTNSVPQPQRWKKALKTVHSHLDALVEAWRARRFGEWIHGDLHPANAMMRAPGDDAPVVLIDLAEVRPGHWIEDAVYLERLLWSRPDRLKDFKPVREIARARRERGLPADDDYLKLAMIRRVLMAATAPRFMRTEGAPAHLNACLERLEGAPAEMKKYGL